jgi:hypothetical protein
MTVMAFEGPAGAGKTHRLMDELQAALAARPLAEHERVLALTYMNGSRRRLDGRLAGIEALSGRYEATTLDSFAFRLTRRWRRFARHLGEPIPQERDYNDIQRARSNASRGGSCADMGSALLSSHLGG